MNIDEKIKETKEKIENIEKTILKTKKQINILENQGRQLDDEMLKQIGALEAYENLLLPAKQNK